MVREFVNGHKVLLVEDQQNGKLALKSWENMVYRRIY